MMDINAWLERDDPMSLTFTGCREAELFTEQIRASLEGVLTHNYYYDPENVGFLSASVDGRFWTGTMWTRDAGTMLRELTHYGYYGRACLTALQLMKLVVPNEDGFYSFPERFDVGKGGSGHELDGTCAIIIGMLLLYERIRLSGDPLLTQAAQSIRAFLTQKNSPVYYAAARCKNGLAAGTGEFGGGCGISGEWCNSVQNFLIYYALSLTLRLLGEEEPLAEVCAGTIRALQDGIRAHLTAPDGFVWCVDPKTLCPVPEILEHPINRGAVFVNGIGAMYADVFGFCPRQDGFFASEDVIRTFQTLLSWPIRAEQYEKYGFYSQFVDFLDGMLSSPSYGFGYAIQTATLFDLPQRDKILSCLIRLTDTPDPRYHLTRENRGWFYERCYSPDLWERPIRNTGFMENGELASEGCGALNLVNVAEPLKIARLLAGLDNTGGRTALCPRLPHGWNAAEIHNATVVSGDRLQKLDITVRS